MAGRGPDGTPDSSGDRPVTAPCGHTFIRDPRVPDGYESLDRWQTHWIGYLCSHLAGDGPRYRCGVCGHRWKGPSPDRAQDLEEMGSMGPVICMYLCSECYRRRRAINDLSFRHVGILRGTLKSPSPLRVGDTGLATRKTF
jgi:hypothetical protein